MNTLTKELLVLCKAAGIKRVVIGVRTRYLPHSLSFPFDVSDEVFTDEVDGEDGWPAIWGILEELNISAGCGNAYSHQVKSDVCLTQGSYDLTKLEDALKG